MYLMLCGVTGNGIQKSPDGLDGLASAGVLVEEDDSLYSQHAHDCSLQSFSSYQTSQKRAQNSCQQADFGTLRSYRREASCVRTEVIEEKQLRRYTGTRCRSN